MSVETLLHSLTPRTREVFEFVKRQILSRGYGPTVREIGNELGIRSPNGVMVHLKALEKKGLITRESHMSRSIQFSEPVRAMETGPPRAVEAELSLLAAWKAGTLKISETADGLNSDRIAKAFSTLQDAHDQTAESERSTEWTEQKNSRRCELIDLDLAGTISDAERVELHRLQKEAIDHRDSAVPLPVSGARELHSELLKKKQQATRES